VLFIVAIATDGIDGYLARKYEIVTDLGKLSTRSPTRR
jgi:CDP-diacylglycerol--glycerol-3-phosphate 3-phosphatidyltransferase